MSEERIIKYVRELDHKIIRGADPVTETNIEYWVPYEEKTPGVWTNVTGEFGQVQYQPEEVRELSPQQTTVDIRKLQK